MKVVNFLELPLIPENIHGSNGLCPHASIFKSGDFDTPIRFLNYTVIPSGVGYGLHKHGNDNELYIVLSGEGIYTEDGESIFVKTGSVMLNAPFGTHKIENTGSDDLRILVIAAANK